MDEHNINDLLESALGERKVGETFKEQLLHDSTTAFNRGRIFHRRLQTGALILSIFAVTTAAFIFGRLSVPEKTSEQQSIAQHTDSDKDSVRVSRDLVAWLDAARFFTQLGMEQRAELSYKQASQLIPLDTLRNTFTDIGQYNTLAVVLKDVDKTDLKSSQHDQKKQSQKPTNKILAQNFGGQDYEL